MPPENGEILSCVCPLCRGAHFSHLTPYLDHLTQYDRMECHPESQLALCEGCGAVLRLPLVILPPEQAQRHGEAYYAGCPGVESAPLDEVLTSHVLDWQVPHYRQFHRLLSEQTTPREHPRWLDVGSAGPPTAFDDFHFTTLEPSPDAVRFGRRHFNPERIHGGVIEHYQADQPFDGVLFLGSLYCIPTPDEALASAARLLRPGGWLVIGIGGFFVETVPNTPDGEYAHLENVWMGSTMWVYYNRVNLPELCARHGFTLLRELVDPCPAHPHQTFRFWIFAKNAPPREPDFSGGAALTRGLLDGLLGEFRQRTAAALAELDRPDVALVGQRELLAEMGEIRPWSRIRHVVDGLQPRLDGVWRLDGLDYSSFERLAAGWRSGEVKVIVVAAVAGTEAMVRTLAERLMELGVDPLTLDLRMPTRRSPMGRLFGWMMGRRVAVRALIFRPHGPNTARLLREIAAGTPPGD
ncbi:MAG: methyltransferase domain-containing protein [Magnetococcales bacterium]|nr:methyltransferase domain-containing protein [Magnetococcales bacterium]